MSEPTSSPATANTLDAIMTREVVTVRNDTALYEVQGYFREGRFRHVFVTNGEGVALACPARFCFPEARGATRPPTTRPPPTTWPRTHEPA